MNGNRYNETMEIFYHYSTPIGILCAKAAQGSMMALSIAPRVNSIKDSDAPIFENLQQALHAYFTGDGHALCEIPIRMQGSDFEKRVWEALRTIPFGETRTYGEIAAMIGKPGSARAVGGACHRNPILLCIPCHRVIGAGGKLTGFGAGMENKILLLQPEHHIIKKEIIKT